MNFRRIVVDNKIYRYVVGKTGTIVIRSDDKKFVTDVTEVKGISFESFDRGKRKKTKDGMVFPSEIERWIKSNA